MSALFKAPYKASKDSVFSLSYLLDLFSDVCVFTVEPVTVFIVWLL